MSKVMEYAIRSHIHLAIFSFIYIHGIYNGNEHSPYYALMFAFSILSIYNFHRLWKLRRGDLPDVILNWLEANKASVIFISIISLLLAGYLYARYFAQNYLIHLFCFDFYQCKQSDIQTQQSKHLLLGLHTQFQLLLVSLVLYKLD